MEVVAGKADRLDIKLDAMKGIVGVFGARRRGPPCRSSSTASKEELGPSPAKAPLYPHHTYQVLFEKPGYVSANRPVMFNGAQEEKTAVTLEKASAAGEPIKEVVKAEPPKPEPPKPEVPKQTPPKAEPPKVASKPDTGTKVATPKADPPKVDPPKADPPKAGGTGMLALGSKPSCEIYVDGAKTDKFTPVPNLSLSAGKHRITLVNNEYGIKESFVVEISADKTTKMIKDFSDRLPK